MLSGELVVQRHRVMVIHQHHRRAFGQRVPRIKYLRVTLTRNHRTNINDNIIGLHAYNIQSNALRRFDLHQGYVSHHHTPAGRGTLHLRTKTHRACSAIDEVIQDSSFP